MNNGILILKRISIGLLVYVLTVIVLASIQDVIVSQKVPVSLPMSMYINRYDNHVFAKGTWKIEGDLGATSLQTSTIQCDKLKNECTIATGVLDRFGGRAGLSVDLEHAPIMNWSANNLVYVVNDYDCVSYHYTIDWLTKSGTGIRTIKPEKIKNIECSVLDKEVRLTLKNGDDVYKEEKKSAEAGIINTCLNILFFWT